MERFFGRIQTGFSLPEDLPATPGVQYTCCKNGSVPHVTVITTAGLSRYELASSSREGKHKHIHQELFIMLRDEDAPQNAPALLHQVVIERRDRGAAVLRGEVLIREGPVIPHTNFVALYCTVPVYYPEQMRTCQTEGVTVIFCWLLPITHSEYHFISENGWSRFEELLDQAQFDLFDLRRPSVV